MSYLESRFPLILLLICSICLSGCVGACNEPVGYPPEPPSAFGKGAYCVSDAGAGGAGGDAAPDAGGGEFEKPSDTRTYRRRFMEPGSTFSSGGPSLRLGARVRPYMLGRKAGTAWLYEDEHFAVDGYLQYIGREAPDRLEVNLLVLVDYRPVPFRLSYVGGEGGWRPRETFEDLAFDDSQQVTLKRRIPYNYTLVIPPEALGDKGIHDVQILTMGTVEPEPNDETARRSANIQGVRFTTYYGATTPRHTPSDGDIDIEPVRPTEPMFMHMFTASSLLYPADDRSALAANAMDVRPDLGGVIEADGERAELEATIGSEYASPRDEHFYLVLDGNQPIEGLHGLGGEISWPSTYEEADGPFADRLSFSVELDDGVYPISVAILPYPDCGYSQNRHRGSFPRLTNTLFVRRGR